MALRTEVAHVTRRAREERGAFGFIPIFILAAGLLLTAPSPARAQGKGNQGDERMAREERGAFGFIPIFILAAGLLLTAPSPARAQGKGNQGDELPEEDESRIIGGRPCSITQRPFQVALIKRGQILCGGSLIDAQWVLTAAHCRQPIR
ncbi:PREDICTED: serine protease 44-like [Charadrius vociferus]|uniref:serine protease 44-like n=1 Tax=Charadrius vociferus TaxID=50402 RepID=UPI0005215BE4|nr:PREDICTED: serine protease 44-like [Charadrius vociferus]